MTIIGCDFVPTRTHRTNIVGFHQSRHTTLTNSKPCYLDLYGHPRTAIGPVAQGKMLTDMRQNLQVGALALAHGPGNPRPVATRRDLQDPTQAHDGPAVTMRPNKREPHVFWLAKNCVAFFNISLSSRRTRFSRRRRSFSRTRSVCASGAVAVRSLDTDTAKSSGSALICQSPDPLPPVSWANLC